MGEVYRARDTRLDRIVAVKVLSDALSGSSDLRERFDREARAVAALNHPHICTLHDVGHEGGVDFLVMEYVDGETVADRLKTGPLPIAEVLRYGMQIADALDRAHRAGIIHRDLKPGNVMLTKSGAKLLDFGLAKHAAPHAAAGVTLMPTTPANLTAAGTILGTFQYMAPEQLEGRDADARTDIFAFGTLLYEMATGRKAFDGKTQATLIASILDREPQPVTTVVPAAPPALERVIRIAIAKDPDDRWQTARDMLRELKEAAGVTTSVITTTPATGAITMPTARSSRLPWILAALASILAVAAVVFALRKPEEAPAAISRFVLSSPPKTQFTSNTIVSAAPNGRYLAFTAGAEGSSQLWLRPLESAEAVPVAGTAGGGIAFWSPDSRYLGFFADGKLKKLPISGGPPIVICDAPVVGNNRGGAAWGSKDVIVFQPANEGPLHRVAAGGGASTPATTLDKKDGETAHRYPTFLPDGDHFLFVALPSRSIVLASLSSPERKTLFKADSKPVFARPGYVLFLRQNTLMAQRFDTKRLDVVGDPIAVGQTVRSNPGFGSAAFAVSDNGLLTYGTGLASNSGQVAWVDKNGRATPALEGSFDYRGIALSPDSKQVVSHRHEEPAGGGLWLTDIARGTTSRFTSTNSHDEFPVWSPDGTQIAFASNRDEKRFTLFVKPANGGSDERQIFKGGSDAIPTDWSADGRSLLFMMNNPKTDTDDVWLLPMTGDRTPRQLTNTPFEEAAARFSPDGRYFTYLTNESKRFELYLQSVAPGGGKWQISNTGGAYSYWRRDGKELYYVTLDGIVKAVSIDLRGPAPIIGTARELFRSRSVVRNDGSPLDVDTGGDRFIMVVPVDQTEASVSVVLNWTAAFSTK